MLDLQFLKFIWDKRTPYFLVEFNTHILLVRSPIYINSEKIKTPTFGDLKVGQALELNSKLITEYICLNNDDVPLDISVGSIKTYHALDMPMNEYLKLSRVINSNDFIDFVEISKICETT